MDNIIIKLNPLQAIKELVGSELQSCASNGDELPRLFLQFVSLSNENEIKGISISAVSSVAAEII